MGVVVGRAVGVPGVPDGISVMVGDNSTVGVMVGKQALVGVHVAVEVASGVTGSAAGEQVEPVAAITNNKVTTATSLTRLFLCFMISPINLTIPMQAQIPYILVVIHRTGAEEPVYPITFQLCIFIF